MSKIVITGASGYVGRQLVDRFCRLGLPMVLVGRDRKKLESSFYGIEVASYDELYKYRTNGDVFIHLAAQNNLKNVQSGSFHEANVELLKRVIDEASSFNLKRFINISTTHALAGQSGGEYGISKGEGDRLISNRAGLIFTTIVCPAIYGNVFNGKLAVLNYLPRIARRPLLHLLALLKPVVSIDTVLSQILQEVEDTQNLSRRILLSDDQDQNPLYIFCMRFIDLVIASLVLLFLGWLLIGVALIVRIDLPGPAIFAQNRIGRFGKVFICYKFRTMAIDTPEKETHRIEASTVTRFGRFLRRTKIDELPQIFNIFRNEMSLVGPRPCLVSQSELIEKRRLFGIDKLKPGITGYGQYQGIDMSDADRLVEAERVYLAIRTLWLNIRIILGTFLGAGRGDRVRAADTKGC